MTPHINASALDVGDQFARQSRFWSGHGANDDAEECEFGVTTAEQEFLNLVFVHFESGWQLAKQGMATPLAVLSLDVRAFFRLPIARAVWDETRWSRNPQFVKFVDRVLVRLGRTPKEKAI